MDTAPGTPHRLVPDEDEPRRDDDGTRSVVRVADEFEIPCDIALFVIGSPVSVTRHC